MITPKQWEAFSPERKRELTPLRTFIPENQYRIPSGHYQDRDIVALLRKHKRNPAAIQFIADMLE